MTTLAPLCHIEYMPSILLKRDYVAGSYYHIKHTAKNGTILFKNDSDYQNFVLLLSYYLRFPDATPLSWVKRLNPKTVVEKRNKSKLGATPVTLHSFLLLPDHFHLVVRENMGGDKPGVSNLMRRLSVGYAMHYNKANNVAGTIYQGKYKNIVVPQNDLSGLIDSLHHHEGVNNTFLATPTHSSRPDYTSSARPWISPLPISPDAPTLAPSKRLLLDK